MTAIGPSTSSYSITDYAPAAPTTAPVGPDFGPAAPQDGFTMSDELSEEGGTGGCGTDQDPCGNEGDKSSEPGDAGNNGTSNP